jgi:hypothetical protein
METVLISGIIDLVIKGAEYLASLPEQDRQKVIAQWRTASAALATDRSLLVSELDKLKAEHEALKAAQAAVKTT